MPAPSNIERWFSQVGSLTQTSLSGNQWARKSAPTFRPPLEPIVCKVAMRCDASTSLPAPNSSACTALRKLAAPSIGRYGFGPPRSTTSASARRTDSSTGMRPASSK